MSNRIDTIVPPPPDRSLRYRRILLKLSGEALCGQEGGFGIHPDTLHLVASELGDLHRMGVQTGIVVGGGNIFRGLKGASHGMDRSQSDYMGMLATVINSLALQDALEKQRVPTRVMTALEIRQVAEPYIRRRAMRHLDKGYFVRPTVFSDVRSDMTIAQEEIFGPVLSILPYDTEEEAIAIANDTVYGLAGGVWSGDPERAKKVALQMRTGQVEVNGGGFNLMAPFGGFKQSGHGRELGKFGLEEFMELKSLQT